MQQRKLIEFMAAIEKLKCNTRHSWTSTGRRESVAEHSWRLAAMAMLCADEFPHADIGKVIKMCLVHDWGEAITGDIPAFDKTDAHEREEDRAVERLLSMLDEPYRTELTALFAEMNALETEEAKLYKALDKMETLLSHNEAPLDTWLPLEYEANLIYGQEQVNHSDWLMKLKDEIKKDSLEKIQKTPEARAQLAESL